MGSHPGKPDHVRGIGPSWVGSFWWDLLAAFCLNYAGLNTRSLREREGHDLVIKPLAWVELFGITDPKKVQAVRERVIRLVYQQEAKYRKERTRPVMGAQHLRSQRYFKPHTPAKRARKVFVISSDPEIRKQIIAFVQQISQKCRVCYARMKQGLLVRWPKGIFIPWLPPKEFGWLSP